MIQEAIETLGLLFTLLAASQPATTIYHSIDSIPTRPSAIRRPARDPFATTASARPSFVSQLFVQPTIPRHPDYPLAVLTFEQSANQVLDERRVVRRSRDSRTGKPVFGQVKLGELISQSAEREGIDPKLVEIVIKHESAFDPEAASGVGARGLMQLMPDTAKELGVTDITDPAQNIAAGTKYLAQQLHRYQDLPLALAAYNAGPGNVDHYGTIPPFEETQNYANSISREYKACRVAR